VALYCARFDEASSLLSEKYVSTPPWRIATGLSCSAPAFDIPAGRGAESSARMITGTVDPAKRGKQRQ
jgi:hypothetical protein